MAYNFSQLKKQTQETEEWLKKELVTVRTGRSTPAILDSILVESYGARVPIQQIATVATEGARSLRIAPWDITQGKAIEKAITAADLGLSVNADDKGLRVIFPELTSERREAMIKIVGQKLEHARVTLRNSREATWEEIQKMEKEKTISEDEKFRYKNEMQKIIDDANKNLDMIASRKEEEIKN